MTDYTRHWNGNGWTTVNRTNRVPEFNLEYYRKAKAKIKQEREEIQRHRAEQAKA